MNRQTSRNVMRVTVSTKRDALAIAPSVLCAVESPACRQLALQKHKFRLGKHSKASAATISLKLSSRKFKNVDPATY